MDTAQQLNLFPHLEVVPQAELKDTNPKDAIGSTKLPLHLVPDTAPAYLALAFCEGATKYGAYNWRVAGVRASIYMAAARRHMAKFWNGEWEDPKTKVPHLASAMACMAIILDARLVGKLTDDRPPAAPLGSLIDGMAETVQHLQEMHKDMNPRHWTIADSDPQIVGKRPDYIIMDEVDDISEDGWVKHTPGEPMPPGLRGKKVLLRFAGIEGSDTVWDSESMKWGFIPHDPACEIVAWKLAE